MAKNVRSKQTPPMANHLKAWRDSRGWSMDEMARHLGGATGSQVNKLEKGKQKLTGEWIARYAKAFGVPQSAILEPPGQVTTPFSAPPEFNPDAFIASIRLGMQLSGVTLSRAEEMKLTGNALEIYERILAGADPAKLVAELIKPDDAAAGKPAKRG